LRIQVTKRRRTLGLQVSAEREACATVARRYVTFHLDGVGGKGDRAKKP
jgi:hypothetical protein